jgi:peroxiredoxin Q/BCP
LEAQEGGRITLNDYRGSWLVLYFYPKDNTPGCTLEARDFTCLQNQFASFGVRVLGVSRTVRRATADSSRNSRSR